MIFSVEAEVADLADRLGFEAQPLAEEVCAAVLAAEGCPFTAAVALLITDDDGIREINRQARGIDAPTDVLSFPGLVYETPADFVLGDRNAAADVTDPETGAVQLGDIVLNIDRVIGQAKEYGHGRRREFAFLLVHAMLHLCGYDHIEEADAERMEARQRQILTELAITR